LQQSYINYTRVELRLLVRETEFSWSVGRWENVAVIVFTVILSLFLFFEIWLAFAWRRKAYCLTCLMQITIFLEHM
jgi:hypothetical protein